jgi:hypothetical protein
MSEPGIMAGLGGFALLAGLVDAVAGGGGLIQLPALLLLWPDGGEATALAAVLGTNKFSSICGTGLAAVQYARRVPLNWVSLLPAAGAALAGSWLGARVVTGLNPALLRQLILGLLVAVAGYTFVRKDLGRLHAPRFSPRQERWLGAVVGAGIGFYDGFFGPGTGSFLIFAFVGLFGFDFLTASAGAKVINFATNLSALAYFAATDHIRYRYALPMAACNMAGALLGARLALERGNRFVRGFFLVVVTAMILRYGYEVLGR